jgi:hypothetical protein
MPFTAIGGDFLRRDQQLHRPSVPCSSLAEVIGEVPE